MSSAAVFCTTCTLYSRSFSFSFLLDLKIIHLIDGTDLFKIGNLVSGRKAIVTSLYCSLEGQREREREQPAGCVQGFTRVTTRETDLPL